MTFTQLREKAGHTQEQAAGYLYCSLRTIKAMEANTVTERHYKARCELYQLKLEKEGKL
jgi:DNA-binding XRE family transcriptional regulator